MKIRTGFVSNSSSSSFVISTPMIYLSDGCFVSVEFVKYTHQNQDISSWNIVFKSNISEPLYFIRIKKNDEIEWSIMGTNEYIEISACEICKTLEELFIKFKRKDKLKRILKDENKS